jgi:calcineurin-like phosphoesterase family protein
MISDTHFFHQRIIELAGRPYGSVEEMNEAMVDNWNRVVTKRDTVWHLGDVCFGHVNNLQIIKRLNGIKNLIMGNHDQYGIRAYTALFNKIEAVKKYDSYLLSHIPIHPDQFYRFEGNVHGHLHNKVVMSFDEIFNDDSVPDILYYNVSVERINYTPKPWEEIKKEMR